MAGTVLQPNFQNVIRTTNIQLVAKTINGGENEIGSIKEFTNDEAREITEHFAFGTGGNAFPRVLIDGLRTRGEITARRVAIYGVSIVRDVIDQAGSQMSLYESILNQNMPFDIWQHVVKYGANVPWDQRASTASGNFYTIIYKDAWFASRRLPQVMQDDVSIIEEATIKYTSILVSEINGNGNVLGN